MAAGAGGRSRLRTSDADREQVVELLKAAFVQGRLAKDEFDVRVGQVLASRTYAELDAAVAGIPEGVAAVQPPWTRLGAYVASRRHKSAIGQYERALADQERMHGPDHPATIMARAALAAALRMAGKMKNAIGQYERVLADRERIRGPDHLDTIVARANLAFAYRSAGRLREAVPAYERTLADRERVQGLDHQDTLAARANLAACYQLARRLTDRTRPMAPLRHPPVRRVRGRPAVPARRPPATGASAKARASSGRSGVSSRSWS